MLDTSDATGSAGSRPTMRHVAALAGVGIKTVSRVVNGEPNVSQKTIERVREAVQRLDYQLDLNAGNLKRANGRTLTLGLLVGSVANPFSGAVHRAIEQKAWERDTAVFASSLGGDPDREQAIVRAFLRRRVDGMILRTAGGIDSCLAADATRRTPLVFIGRASAGVGADAVISDKFTGAAQAARHLLDHGHRRIAYCGTGDRAEIQTARERRRGFMEELGRAGVAAADVRVLQDLNDAETARKAVATLLRSGSRPTAIFAGDSLATIGAIRALRESGLHNSVALVGFDDFALADLVEPGVTLIAQDPRKIGQIAAERLFARIDGSREEPKIYAVPTTLIARGSGELRARD
jgi:LacI family transcriptional regulator